MTRFNRFDHDDALAALGNATAETRRVHADACHMLEIAAGDYACNSNSIVTRLEFDKALATLLAAPTHDLRFVASDAADNRVYLTPSTPWRLARLDGAIVATFSAPDAGNECLSGPEAVVGLQFGTRDIAREAVARCVLNAIT